MGCFNVLKDKFYDKTKVTNMVYMHDLVRKFLQYIYVQISNIKFGELFFSLCRLQEGHHPKKVTWLQEGLHPKKAHWLHQSLHQGLHPKKILSHRNSNSTLKKELSSVQCSIML